MSSEQFEHIRQIRMGFQVGSKKLKSSLMNSIKILADDLYNKHTHFIFELIQNAEDNSYKKHNTQPPYISFQLTKYDPTSTPGSTGALIIQNNETGFNSENVNAICAVGETTKKKDQGYIGEKGIGFKSVFRVSDNPHIFSNGYYFSLPKCDEETGLGYIVPQWIDTTPNDLNLSETHIILPLTKSDFGYEKIEEMLHDIEPEVILFLSSLQEIRIRTDSCDNLTILKDNSADPEVGIIVEGKKQGDSYSKSENFLVCTKRFDKPLNISHDKREGIEKRDVSVVFPLDQNSKAVGKIFAYLPVRSDTNFPFLINADFILPSSREDIRDDVSWNHWLMKCVANLATSDLFPLLKERKLLKVEFLESLASRLNDLVDEKNNLFYSIYTRAYNVFKNEQFLPTNDDTFVSAKNAVLARSDAVRNVLSHSQLGQLFSCHNCEFKWLSSEITLDRTPNLRKYVKETLDIEEVTPVMFASRISENFLSMQTDEWFIKFYKFLSDQPALWRYVGAILQGKPILRLQDRTHVNPSQAGFPPTAYLFVGAFTNTSLPIVKLEISQNKDAFEFLKTLGVQEYDIVAEVIENVLPKYDEESSAIPLNEHLRDYSKIKKAYDTDSREKKTHLKNALQDTPFIYAEKPDINENKYFKPDQLYFYNDYLRIYFKDNPSYAFVNLDVYPYSAQKLFSDLGVMNSVRVKRKEKDSRGYVAIHSYHGNHKRGLDGFDPHIEVDGLEHALNDLTPEKSVIIWNQIAIPNANCIKGTVEESTRRDYEPSTQSEKISDSFGELLIKKKWLPDANGKMHLPSEISIDDLHESFKENKQLEEKLNMKISINNMINKVSSEIGISSDILNGIREASSEVIERIESLLQSPSDNSSIYGPISQDTPFPIRSIQDPERRKKRVIEDLDDSPVQEYVELVRNVRTSRGTIDPKTWLTEQYKNNNEQVVCQICQEEMPFKYGRGIYYFDAVELLKGYFTKEYEAQFLALCPECSTKYKKFVKQVPEAMETLINNLVSLNDSRDYIVPLKLADEDKSLRFVETHWFDIKAILSYYAQQPDSTQEISTQDEVKLEPQAIESPQTDKRR